MDDAQPPSKRTKLGEVAAGVRLTCGWPASTFQRDVGESRR